MNFNLHGYKYQVGDVTWILTDELESRSGICVAVNGNNYDILMDDTHSVETFDKSKLFPLKSYTEIKRQTLVSPTPTITPSTTPAVTRTPKPSATPHPTPSVSATNKKNLLSTSNATWTTTDGIVTTLSSDKMKLTSNVALDHIVYAIASNPTPVLNVGVSFSTDITVQPHSDYAIAFDMDQGSCRFISVIVTRSGSNVPLFSQKYMDSTRLNVVLNTYDSNNLTITVQLYDDANFSKKARHGRYYTINRLNMSYVKYNNVTLPHPTPTPTNGGLKYDALVASLNPLYYWSLKTGANSTIGNNPLQLGVSTTLVPDTYGNTLHNDNPAEINDGDIFGAKFSNPVSLNKNYTLEAWINIDALFPHTSAVIFGSDDNNGSSLAIGPQGALTLYGNNDDFEVDFGFVPSTDYHIVMTVDSSNKILFYVNGAKFEYGNASSISDHSSDTYNYSFIGSDIYADILVGKIGDAAIYNKVLTDAEVLANYNAGTNGYRYTPHTVIAPPAPVFLPHILSRLNSDGTIDTTYNSINPNQGISAISDFNGKMMIGGDFTAFNGALRRSIFKLDNTGALSTIDFNPNKSTTALVVCEALDGKIYIGGDSLNRYNADGTEDDSFTLPPSLNVSGINAIAQHQSGYIYMIGSMSIDGNNCGVIRFNSDGTLDSTYSMDTGWSAPTRFAITDDGKMYLFAGFSSINGTDFPNSIARLNSDGTLDTGFTGFGMTGYEITMFEQMSDGKIYAGSINRHAIRLNSDGTLDDSTTLSVYNGNLAAKEFNGKIYMSYYNYGGPDYGILRLNSDGTIDETYIPLSIDDEIASMAIINDKLYIGGKFSTVNGYNYAKLARLNADGSLDTTFDNLNISIGDIDYQLTLTKVTTGLFVSGDFYSVGGNTYTNLAMINDDGTLDTSFKAPYILGKVSDILRTNNDFLYYSGVFNVYNKKGDTDYGYLIGRLNADGTFDTTFTISNTASPNYTDSLASMLEAADGKVYTKTLSQYNNGNQVTLLREYPDGTDDEAYISPIFNGNIHSMVQTNDGKIYVGGQFTKVNGISYNLFCRLNSDGTLDTDFADLGIQTGAGGGGGQALAPAPQVFGVGGGPNAINGIVQDTNGKIYIGGNFVSVGASSSPYIARLNADGTLETSFGVAISNPIYNMSYINGMIYISNGAKLNRIKSDGSLDTEFEYTSHSTVNTVYKHANGKIYVGSDYFDENSSITLPTFPATTPIPSSTPLPTLTPRPSYDVHPTPTPTIALAPHLARLTSNGAVDGTFTDLALSNDVITMLKTNDGKIYVGGYFTNFLIRLNSDGTLDNTFTDPALLSAVNSLVQTADDKIYVGGNNYLVRLNSDGTLDNTFTDLGVNYLVAAITQTVDGKIYVGGNAANNIIRLNSDGTLDNTFANSGLAGAVSVITQTADGKIYVGGEVDGYLIRLNADGTLDNTFTDLTLYSDVYSVVQTIDGKIYVGGDFDNYLIRLNSDGTVDGSFNDLSLTSDANYIKQTSDGKIYVGGDFANYLIRLNSDGTLDNTLSNIGLTSDVYWIVQADDDSIYLGGDF